MPEAIELRTEDIDPPFAKAWDALPAARETQADIYDSHAWFAAWLSAEPRTTADKIRIPAVVQEERPVALLPLVLSEGGRRAAVVGMNSRTRARPVVGSEHPERDTLGLLAEGIARIGVRDISLHRMPSRDPVAELFPEALRDAGFRVTQRQRSSDNLAAVEGSWPDYVRTFKGFAGYAKRFSGRLTSLWEVDVETYGTTAERPALHGFESYEELHRRSWKGELRPADRKLRTELLERVDANGWARVYVLRIGGVPAAAHIWFRLGQVATWLSTAYDQRLAALSPGTISMWQAQIRLLNEDPPPRLVDLLPGSNPQKDRLTLTKPPLLLTEAIRPTVWSGVSVPARRHAQRLKTAAAARIRRRRRDPSPAPEPTNVVTVTVAPEVTNASARRLEIAAPHRRYLATASGHAAPEKMAASWGTSDEWWLIGDGPDGLIRITPQRDGVAVREIVRIQPGAEPRALLVNLASVLGEEVSAHGVPFHDALLPWPRSWHATEVGGQR